MAVVVGVVVAVAVVVGVAVVVAVGVMVVVAVGVAVGVGGVVAVGVVLTIPANQGIIEWHMWGCVGWMVGPWIGSLKFLESTPSCPTESSPSMIQPKGFFICAAKTCDMVSRGRSWHPLGSQNRAGSPPHPGPTGVRPASIADSTGDTAPHPQATEVGPVVLLSLKKTEKRHHKCAKSDICTCWPLALEPAEDCPVHGAGPWPPRCGTCGRFMSYSGRKVTDYYADYENP